MNPFILKVSLALILAFGGIALSKNSWPTLIIGMLLMIAGQFFLEHYWEFKR